MQKIWTLPTDKKIELPLNAARQPVGGSGQTFIRWLDTFCLCPAYCPLMPLNWTHVPPNHKEDAWIEIQKKWIINPEIIHPANQMMWAMHLLGELRRNRLTELKKKCYPKDASKEEVLAKIPEWADAQQYAELVDYWFHPDTQEKESGQAVERAVVFTKAYSKKDGTPVSTDVEDKIKKMAEILNNGVSLEGERHQGILWSKTDVFAQVMGKERCGCVRGVGFGPTPSRRSRSNLPCYTSTPPSSSETAQRMTDLENLLRDELAQSEQRHQEQIANMLAQHKEEIAKLHARHKVEITKAVTDAMRNILDQLQPFLNTLSVSQGSAPSQCLR